jgi:hypothetical protein
MALSDDEKKLLAELQAREAEPDFDPDDFEVELYNEQGRGTRIPYKRGKSWLYENFGIGDPPEPPSQEEGGSETPEGKETKKTTKTTRASGGQYFGSKRK